MSDGKDLASMRPEDLQNAVQGILSNPAFSKLLGELSGTQGQTSPANMEAPAQPTAAAAQISPEMLAKLPQMMTALSPLLSGKRDGKEGDAHRGDAGDAEKRKRLLAALKPYLNGTRRDAVDSIMKVTEMTDLMEKMGFGAPRHPPK